MSSRPIPHSFWLFMVFGLLIAGIVATAGFAIDKAGRKDDQPAVAAATEAVAELVREGQVAIEDLDEDDPALDLLAEAPPPPAKPESPQIAEPPSGGEPDAAPQTAEPPGGGEPDVARGEDIFFANGCAACHGDNGQGGIGPTIASTKMSLDDVIAQYRNPRGIMPPFDASRVSDAEVNDVYAWLQTLPLPDNIVPGLGTP